MKFYVYIWRTQDICTELEVNRFHGQKVHVTIFYSLRGSSELIVFISISGNFTSSRTPYRETDFFTVTTSVSPRWSLFPRLQWKPEYLSIIIGRSLYFLLLICDEQLITVEFPSGRESNSLLVPKELLSLFPPPFSHISLPSLFHFSSY